MASRTRNDHFQDITIHGSLSMGADSTVEGNLIPDTADSRELGDSTHSWAGLRLAGAGVGSFGTGGMQGPALLALNTDDSTIWHILFQNASISTASVIGGIFFDAQGSLNFSSSGATPNTTESAISCAGDGDITIVAATNRDVEIWSNDDATKKVSFDGGNIVPGTATPQQLGTASLPWRVYHDVVATGSLPAAGASMNGVILIEDGGTGDRNLIVYAGGQRFRIDGGAAF